MPTESELIRSALDGDRSATRDLLMPLEQPIYAYLRKILGNEADADDVTQEVFLTAIDQLTQFQNRGSFRAWVYQIAYRKALNWIRDNKKRQTTTGVEETDSGFPDARSQAETDEIRRLVSNAVNRLTTEQQSVVWMRMKSNLSFKEISEATGVPLGTVLSRMHQAKTRLAQLLEFVKQ